MIFIVMFSTVSFSVDKHYCGNTLVDTAIFSEAQSCGMEMKEKALPKNCSSIKKSSCCNDVKVSIEGQDELKNTFQELSFEQEFFIKSFMYSYINLFEGLEKNIVPCKNYPPPLLIKHIYQFDESYLI